MRTFIHYGHDHFDKELFEPIRNGLYSIKPWGGGFYASSIDTLWGWKEWCIAEGYKIDSLSTSFKFNITDDAKVLLIDDILKLRAVLSSYRLYITFELLNVPFLNFEKIAEHYDVIEVLAGSNRELYHSLYGWDCDTLLVMNPDIIVPIK